MDSVWNRNSLIPFVVHITFECTARNTNYQVSKFGTRGHCCQKIMECVACCERCDISTQNVLCIYDPWCWAWLRRAARCCDLEPCEWIHCGDVLIFFSRTCPFFENKVGGFYGVCIECRVWPVSGYQPQACKNIPVSCFVKEVVIVPVDKYTEVLMYFFRLSMPWLISPCCRNST